MVLWGYTIAVILIIIYPPYYIDNPRGEISKSGYSWIWEPISDYYGVRFEQIELVKLGIEFIGISVIAGVSIALTIKKTSIINQ